MARNWFGGDLTGWVSGRNDTAQPNLLQLASGAVVITRRPAYREFMRIITTDLSAGVKANPPAPGEHLPMVIGGALAVPATVVAVEPVADGLRLVLDLPDTALMAWGEPFPPRAGVAYRGETGGQVHSTLNVATRSGPDSSGSLALPPPASGPYSVPS